MVKIEKQLNKNVVVAMSGGVDSSVAAALFKRKYRYVTGIFLKFWSEGQKPEDLNKCCSWEAEKIARQTATQLNMPFYTIDASQEFKKAVVDYFLREYSLGRTPNPCVVCNKKIKFGLLMSKALALGADYVATGHYAKIKKTNREYGLFISKDKNKDQSYFLYNLKQEQLKRVLFPLADYTKAEVKQLAGKFKLPVNQRESFDICFISGSNHNQFLKKYLKLKPGPIIDLEGQEIGQHQGLPLYTIGQRREIGIGGTGPYYVIKRDYQKNHLIVSSRFDDVKLLSRELTAGKVNWISGREPAENKNLKAKIRYGHPAQDCQIKKQSRDYQVIFKKAQRAITPGQSVVFYSRDKLFGGGVIKN